MCHVPPARPRALTSPPSWATPGAPNQGGTVMAVKPIPEGYHSLTAQLSIEGADKAIAFYEKAFGAEVLDKALDPSGKKVWHAAIKIGSSVLFVNDIFPDMG